MRSEMVGGGEREYNRHLYKIMFKDKVLCIVVLSRKKAE